MNIFEQIVKKTTIIIVFSICFLINSTIAQDEETTKAEGFRIGRIAICNSIVEREPVGISENFNADIGRIFCFTEVINAKIDTFITHEWYYKDELKATVKLKVSGTRWRTWSSKGIDKNWTGKWRVEVKDAEGNPLASATFEIS